MRDRFLFVSAEWAFLGVRFPYVIEVFVKATVTCSKLDCCSLIFSVVDEMQCSLLSCITLLLM